MTICKWFKRQYWKIKFALLDKTDKKNFRAMGIDPQSLIKKGFL